MKEPDKSIAAQHFLKETLHELKLHLSQICGTGTGLCHNPNGFLLINGNSTITVRVEDNILKLSIEKLNEYSDCQYNNLPHPEPTSYKMVRSKDKLLWSDITTNKTTEISKLAKLWARKLQDHINKYHDENWVLDPQTCQWAIKAKAA